MPVLIAVDCSAVSAEVLAAAAQILSPADEIHIVRLIDPGEERETVSFGPGPKAVVRRDVGTASGGTVRSETVHHVPAETAVQATERVRGERLHDLERLARAVFPPRFNWRAEVVTGKDVAETIVATAAAIEANGIAMGTRGRGGVRPRPAGQRGRGGDPKRRRAGARRTRGHARAAPAGRGGADPAHLVNAPAGRAFGLSG